nr:class II glutamine amidotransferase [uncultured Oscillibacter sp.]
MCCLFGLIDCDLSLSVKQKNNLIRTLSIAAEDRGTDAAGTAYNSGNRLQVYKRPWPAHMMTFHVPQETSVVMGHTRMTTQGNARKNFNNHPFLGHVRGTTFALAHNGVLYNDKLLRRRLRLPGTRIETDSYIAVQLLQQKNALDFASLKYMAEQVEGSFSFTVLDSRNHLYIVKGDSPFCLYYFPALNLYAYASTEAILREGLYCSSLFQKAHYAIPLRCGDLLRIDASGRTAWDRFDDSGFFSWAEYWRPSSPATGRTHLDEIKSVAAMFGYTPGDMDALADQGYSPEELEELIYNGRF